MLLTLLAIIGIITLIFLYIGHLHHTYVLDSIVQEEKKVASKIYSNTFKNFIQKYELIAKSILADQEIIEAFEHDDRKALLALTAPIYKKMTDENPFVQIMHFHTKDTRSYLRLHKPEKFGDDLSTIRHMINKVNSLKTKQVGIEVGRYGIHYRIALPVFNDSKEYLGVFEIGINMNYILDMFSKDYNFDTILLFKKDIFQIMFKNYKELKYQDYSDDYYAIKHEVDDKYHTISNDTAVFTVTTLKNVSGDEIGEIKFVKNLKYYTDKIVLIRSISISIAVLLFSISAYLIYRIFNNYMNIINDYQSKLEIKNYSLTKLSNTDHLTQIHNRHSIETILDRELKKVKRHKTELSLVILDIDDFKKVNDTYGHNVGDEVLKSIAKVVFSSIRETDYFGRWGGEEFIIVSPETSLNNALVMCEKIRSNIYSFDFKEVGRVSCSLGLASYSNDENEHTLIHNADTALYQAKNSGKNKVVPYHKSIL